MGFSGCSAGKESACNAGHLGSIPGLERYPGEGKGSPLQYSGLENSMDCIVHGVAKSWTGLSDIHFHFTHTKKIYVFSNNMLSCFLVLVCFLNRYRRSFLGRQWVRREYYLVLRTWQSYWEKTVAYSTVKDSHYLVVAYNDYAAAAAAAKLPHSVGPHRRQPTWLLCPWDSPGKNTGVGCHFLLQCMRAC